MKAHSTNELKFYADILGPDCATVLLTGIAVGLEDLSGRRLEQAQIESAETSHMMVFHFSDVNGTLNDSCYAVVDGVTYIVDYVKDPRNPRPYMWLEVYCHVEGDGTVTSNTVVSPAQTFKSYVDAGDAATLAAAEAYTDEHAASGSFLPLAGGAVTGPVTMQADGSGDDILDLLDSDGDIVVEIDHRGNITLTEDAGLVVQGTFVAESEVSLEGVVLDSTGNPGAAGDTLFSLANGKTQWLPADSGPTGPQGPQGNTGEAGSNGTNGTRGSLWYEGSGAPGTISGQLNLDLYLNTATSDVWQLQSGTWTNIGNVKGATGAAGSNGTNGTNGTNGSNGARGSLIYSGSGAPGTISGQANGDWYINTANGAMYELVSGTWTLELNITGPTGATGSTGATGPTGPAGPSPSGAANLVLATPNGSSGTASLRALVAADVPTLNQNTSGTAAGLSGTPALPSGTTATTQSAGDNSTDVATDAFVTTAVANATCIIKTAPDYYLLPFGDFSYQFETTTGVMAQNEGFIGLIHLDAEVVFTKVSIYVFAFGASSNVYIGIYNLAGTQVATAKIPITGNGLVQLTGLGPFTLPPGSYWLEVASDNSASTTNLYGATLNANAINNIININQFRWGQKSGQVSSGALLTPITPTVAAGWSKNAVPLPLVLLEP